MGSQFKYDVKGVRGGEVFERFGFVESLPVESEIPLGESLVVDGVSVMGSYSDCFESSGFVDDSAVQNGVIEGVLGKSSFRVLDCQTSCVSAVRRQGDGEIPVVVPIMHPPSEGQFAFDNFVE